MKIGKLELRGGRFWWEGVRLQPLHRIVLTLAVYPVYLLGKLLVAVAAGISDLSLDSALCAWKDI